MSKAELAVALGDCFPGVNIDELMMVFDTDSNGKVSYSEFAPLSKVISTFEQFDTDANGLISREELNAVLQRLAAGAPRRLCSGLIHISRLSSSKR